jgi:hypothetical protein
VRTRLDAYQSDHGLIDGRRHDGLRFAELGSDGPRSAARDGNACSLSLETQIPMRKADRKLTLQDNPVDTSESAWVLRCVLARLRAAVWSACVARKQMSDRPLRASQGVMR